MLTGVSSTAQLISLQKCFCVFCFFFFQNIPSAFSMEVSTNYLTSNHHYMYICGQEHSVPLWGCCKCHRICISNNNIVNGALQRPNLHLSCSQTFRRYLEEKEKNDPMLKQHLSFTLGLKSATYVKVSCRERSSTMMSKVLFILQLSFSIKICKIYRCRSVYFFIKL